MRVIVFTFLTFAVFRAWCQTMDAPAYSRYGDCRTPTPLDDTLVANVLHKAIPPLEPDKPKGYLGTVGVVGGGHAYSEKAYITALSALRVGADVVHVICFNAAGPSIQSYSPDIIVHPILDTAWHYAAAIIQKMDVIVLGPGLDEIHYGFDVLNGVFLICKNHKIPLILHLDEFFLTQHVVNLLFKFPSPGVIMITNEKQFEKFYPLIKDGSIIPDGRVHIKFENYDNFMIMRTGCTDTAVSANPMASWSNSKLIPTRRTAKQDELVSGAAAVYFFWALKNLPANETVNRGAMFPAAVATYGASKMVRKINKLALEDNERSTTTLDMIEKIHEALYGMG